MKGLALIVIAFLLFVTRYGAFQDVQFCIRDGADISVTNVLYERRLVQ
jgi:hypothetical protein